MNDTDPAVVEAARLIATAPAPAVAALALWLFRAVLYVKPTNQSAADWLAALRQALAGVPV